MKLIERLFGAKCAQCGQKIKADRFPLGSRWVCQNCHCQLEEQCLMELEEEERKRAVKLLVSQFPRLQAPSESQGDAAASQELERICSQLEKGEINRLIQAVAEWQIRAETEDVLIRALSSTNVSTVSTASSFLREVGFVDCVPKLIALLDTNNDDLQMTVREALKAIRERLMGGWGICPRCGSSNTTEGNATGWRCNGCDLRYRPRGARDPLAFIMSGGFHGAPWNRNEMVSLLSKVDGVGKARLNGKLLRDFCRSAEQLVAKRQQILKAL